MLATTPSYTTTSIWLNFISCLQLHFNIISPKGIYKFNTLHSRIPYQHTTLLYWNVLQMFTFLNKLFILVKTNKRMHTSPPTHTHTSVYLFQVKKALLVKFENAMFDFHLIRNPTERAIVVLLNWTGTLILSGGIGTYLSPSVEMTCYSNKTYNWNE